MTLVVRRTLRPWEVIYSRRSDSGFIPVGSINDVDILILQILPACRLRWSWDDDRKT